MIFLFTVLIILELYIIFIMFKSYKKNEFGMFWFNFGKYLLGWFFKFYYPFQATNYEVVPKKGAIILCGNHIHLMDQFLCILKIPRPVHYLAKREYFDNPKTRWFFKNVGCIPVDRSNHDENAKEKALEVLEKDLALGIFPEGTRNKTKEKLLPFKFGAVSLARKTNATLVPFAIKGSYKFRTKNLKITFGTPFKVGDMTLEEANQKLYQEILEMLENE